MREAAAAWKRLADALSTIAAQCRSVTSDPAGPWAQHLEWLDATATRAAHTAAQASAAAAAYDAAIAAMVPLPAILANRTDRRTAAHANCLGHATAAIADLDAEYHEMWARNAEAMYAYAHASADVSTLTPFTPPTTASEVVRLGRRVMPAISTALRELCTSPPAMFATSLAPVTASLSKLGSLAGPAGLAINHLSRLNKEAALCRAAALLRAPAHERLAQAATVVAGLSVPKAWAATTNHVAEEPQNGWAYRSMRLV